MTATAVVPFQPNLTPFSRFLPFRLSKILSASLLANVGRRPGPDWGGQRLALPPTVIVADAVVVQLYWLAISSMIAEFRHQRRVEETATAINGLQRGVLQRNQPVG